MTDGDRQHRARTVRVRRWQLVPFLVLLVLVLAAVVAGVVVDVRTAAGSLDAPVVTRDTVPSVVAWAGFATAFAVDDGGR